MFAPVAAGIALVDTEGWFWIKTAGAAWDGGPGDGELHQPTGAGATFAASRAHSASSAATRSSPTSPVPARTSRCSRFSMIGRRVWSAGPGLSDSSHAPLL